MTVTTRQVKAARALLAWSQEMLAQRSGVSYPTVARLESEDGPLGGRADTGTKIVSALEAAGIIFVEENGEGPGVRLRKARMDTKQAIEQLRIHLMRNGGSGGMMLAALQVESNIAEPLFSAAITAGVREKRFVRRGPLICLADGV